MPTLGHHLELPLLRQRERGNGALADFAVHRHAVDENSKLPVASGYHQSATHPMVAAVHRPQSAASLQRILPQFSESIVAHISTRSEHADELMLPLRCNVSVKTA